MLRLNNSQTAMGIMLSSMAWYDEFISSHFPSRLKLSKTARSWEPPPIDHLKLNVDGAFFPSLSHGGVGGVIRN